MELFKATFTVFNENSLNEKRISRSFSECVAIWAENFPHWLQKQKHILTTRFKLINSENNKQTLSV